MKKWLGVVTSLMLMCTLLYPEYLNSQEKQKLETLKIGVSASLSGPAVGWGQPCYQTIKIQALKYNEAGGVKIGNKVYKIDLKTADDKFLAESGAAAIKNLVFQAKVDYILLGGPSALVAQAAGPICHENKVLFVCNGTSGPGLSPEWEWSFRVNETNYAREVGITMWLASNKPEIKNIAIVAPDTEAGHTTTRTFEGNVAKYTPWKILAKEFYEQGGKDYFPILSKLLKEKPDLIYTDTATTGDLALLLKQARELGYNGPFLQAAVVDPQTLFRICGEKAANNLYSPAYSQDVSQALKELYDAYYKEYREYNALTGFSCDYLPVLIQAMQKAGTTDKYKVRDVFKSATKPGVLNSLVGPGARFYEEKATSPGHTRQWLRPISVVLFKDGKVVPLGLFSPEEMIKRIDAGN